MTEETYEQKKQRWKREAEAAHRKHGHTDHSDKMAQANRTEIKMVKQQLKSALLKSLHYSKGSDLDALGCQARALDLVFRRLVTAAEDGDFDLYKTALKTQQQCRETLGAANTLKRQKITLKDPPES